MSADSQQKLADDLMSARYEIQYIGQRIQDLVDLRKQLSHRQKRINEAEYEQILNSPTMMHFYSDYKEANEYSVQLGREVHAKSTKINHNFNRATEEQQLEIYDLQEKWVKAAIVSAEKRLNFLQQYPFVYQDKQAVKGHIIAAQVNMETALKGLNQIKANKRGQ
ncbi:hypothetical protein F53441_11540 [Fusarium austroafricanum]|uniref:Uncharacterized protein n=1 Tax=Fusarium austroafricanum TaxID=2364996 RepID=A0A8H4K419_9HYPO|nr:hypothetical protein F53441_11540 [Fusarium austroafricanum]